MSIKRNILANYAGQIYVTLIAILIVPMYLQYMGTEAYGLIGFYSMLQAWFLLLDMGLTPTMARETARFRGGATPAPKLLNLLRALEIIFVIIALLGASLLIVVSHAIATQWLNPQSLSSSEIQRAISLTAIIIALRWISGLYRSVINGFEHFVWLNAFNIIIASLRFLAVIPFLIWVGASPTHFFSFQLAVAALESLTLFTKSYKILPRLSPDQKQPLQWKSLGGILKFSLGVAFASTTWIVATQTDKLLLSNLLSLSEYAYFSLAVLAASAISFINGPISGALLPRLTKLFAENNQPALLSLYRNTTQLTTAIAASSSLTLAFFSEPILLVWTSNPDLASQTSPILSLYALGNALLSISAFPYFLQFAHGNLKLQFLGSASFASALIPTLLFFTLSLSLGVLGAGYAWLIANSFYFLLFVPFVHYRLYPSLHLPWLLRDVLQIILPPRPHRRPPLPPSPPPPATLSLPLPHCFRCLRMGLFSPPPSSLLPSCARI